MKEQKFIHGSENLMDLWEVLKEQTNRACDRDGVGFIENNYLTSIVIAILGWHGLKKENILELKVFDVTEDGVKGCPYPDFIPKEIEILLKYKSLMNRIDNDFVFTQSRRGTKASESTIKNAFTPIKFPIDNKYDWVRTVFSFGNVERSRKLCEIISVYGKERITVQNNTVQFGLLNEEEKEKVFSIYAEKNTQMSWKNVLTNSAANRKTYVLEEIDIFGGLLLDGDKQVAEPIVTTQEETTSSPSEAVKEDVRPEPISVVQPQVSPVVAPQVVSATTPQKNNNDLIAIARLKGMVESLTLQAKMLQTQINQINELLELLN